MCNMCPFALSVARSLTLSLSRPLFLYLLFLRVATRPWCRLGGMCMDQAWGVGHLSGLGGMVERDVGKSERSRCSSFKQPVALHHSVWHYEVDMLGVWFRSVSGVKIRRSRRIGETRYAETEVECPPRDDKGHRCLVLTAPCLYRQGMLGFQHHKAADPRR